MKSQKGITLMSLLVYVVAFLIVAGIIGSITTFFYSNYSFLDEKSSVATEYNKLNLVLSKECKEIDNYIYGSKSNGSGGGSFYSSGAFSTKYELLQNVKNSCESFFNTYILFYDENFIGWRKNEKVIYYNQTILCENVNNFLITKDNLNGHDVITVYVEFSSGSDSSSTKSFSTKYTI